MAKIIKPKIVIYDLDGTIIDSTELQEAGWQHAFTKVNLPNKFGNMSLPEGFNDYQKGRSGELAARYVYGDNADESILTRFRNVKRDYVNQSYGNSLIFHGFSDTFAYLKSQGTRIWICTSASEEQVNAVLQKNEWLNLDGVVRKGMYEGTKTKGLRLTLELAGNIIPSEALYVGDAEADYISAKEVGIPYVHFCRPQDSIDDKIPKDIKVMRNHRELIDLLK